jgi:ligand-binding sensor protein
MASEQHPTIDQKLILSDLLDLDLLRDLILKFSDFTGIRVRLADEKAGIFLTQGEIPGYCRIIRNIAEGRKLCDKVSDECIRAPQDANLLVHKCFCGLSYIIIQLRAEFELVGRAILGPVLTADLTIPQQVLQLGPPKTQGELNLEKIPVRDLNEVKRTATFLADIMDIFLFLSAKRLSVSRVHLENIYQAREEIFKDMERQMSSKEDREELERLKRIF